MCDGYALEEELATKGERSGHTAFGVLLEPDLVGDHPACYDWAEVEGQWVPWVQGGRCCWRLALFDLSELDPRAACGW